VTSAVRRRACRATPPARCKKAADERRDANGSGDAAGKTLDKIAGREPALWNDGREPDFDEQPQKYDSAVELLVASATWPAQWQTNGFQERSDAIRSPCRKRA